MGAVALNGVRIGLASAATVGALSLALPPASHAQGYRLRVDSRAQSVSYRGVREDSVPVTDTVTGPTGGPTTSDGFAVICNPGTAYCTFFRPGAVQKATPLSSVADATVWGLGLPGLALHATARFGAALGGGDFWPGTDPAVQLLEGYAQYAGRRFTVQAGRQTVSTRLGYTGFDGGQAIWRDPRLGLEVSGYGGWGLWRGSVLPVTSPAANPLGEFRPPERTLVAGGGAAWTSSRVDVSLVYGREVDPSVDYFVSEQAGVNAALRLPHGVTLSGGADYDLAFGWWGNAEATLAYAEPRGRLTATVGVRRYRPHFDLWTIWGAFAPAPYTAFDASLGVTPVRRLRLSVNGERYAFASAAAATPLVTGDSTGWRFTWRATVTPESHWTVEGGYHAEFGPGASSRGFDGAATYAVGERVALGLQGSTLDRPLEFRFDESSLHVYGIYARYVPSSRVRLEFDASRYAEDRQRPDPAAFDWNQVRVSTRVVFAFSSADLLGRGLPPAVRKMPPGPGAEQ